MKLIINNVEYNLLECKSEFICTKKDVVIPFNYTKKEGTTTYKSIKIGDKKYYLDL
jgi:hypothetical protein